MIIVVVIVAYLLTSFSLYGVYRVWSRKTPEYESARNFEDAIAAVACFGWPVTIPILLIYWARKSK